MKELLPLWQIGSKMRGENTPLQKAGILSISTFEM
jgi:hypothetical protein